MRNSCRILCPPLAATLVAVAAQAAGTTLVGWNDLGMHCMDADYSVFSILPPYNTIHAQVIRQGNLATGTAVQLTYEAVADTAGSINKSSIDKTDFWQSVGLLYLPAGAPPLPPDQGLAGFGMPGAANTPQAMRWDAAQGWFTAEGIPITPVDDAKQSNPYPMFRLVAKDAATQAVLASTDIVLPVSAEMDCRACHASGTSAEPFHGWTWDCDPQRDYRLNILRKHDELNEGSSTYEQALAKAGYQAAGLEATARSGHPILCARCHASNALPGTGLAGLPPLTQAVHSWHAYVLDPDTGVALGETTSRSACYRCHPGSETRCLRGAMGSAVAADGSRSMDCQSCHGGMAKVGAEQRTGWLQEPTCQNCHTGTAVKNSGAIRFTSAFDANGNPHAAADDTFATNPNVPVAGSSLFRFSQGHGGLYCSACHGSPHAEFPGTDANDNVRSLQTQGHVGVIAECTACHASTPAGSSGGPHGLHPIGAAWVEAHEEAAERSLDSCRPCHGQDLRGTVLSRSQANRTLGVFGGKTFWRGFQIGCYTCHDGPSAEGASGNHAAVVTDATLNATTGQPASLTLAASDADANALTLRVVAQPAHGTVALTNRTAVYRSDPDYVGPDSFTFAAWDGSTDSNLGHVNVTVAAGSCQITLAVLAPDQVDMATPVPFRASARVAGCDAPATIEWLWADFNSGGDALCRSFATPGTYTWQARATAGGATQTVSGQITVNAPPTLAVARSGNQLQISWPATLTGYALESTASLTPHLNWQAVAQTPVEQNGQWIVTVTPGDTQQFFQLRKTP